MVLSSQAFEPGNFDLEHHWWDMIVKVQGFPLISFGYVRMPSMNILVKNVEIVFERNKKKSLTEEELTLLPPIACTSKVGIITLVPSISM